MAVAEKIVDEMLQYITIKHLFFSLLATFNYIPPNADFSKNPFVAKTVLRKVYDMNHERYRV